MGHAKLDAANELINAVRGVRTALSTAQHARTAQQEAEAMRAVTQAQRDVVRAAYAVADAPTDPESEKAIGKVLLSRLEQSVMARSRDQWDSLGVAAMDAIQEGMKALPPEMKAWMLAVKPVDVVAAEAAARAAEQGVDTMLDGFRRGAAATPGMSLHIEEVVNGHVVRDETVLGPELGETDGSES
ncbi:hypothetical protein ACMT9Y_15200 [Clavibacter tessellarius]|uniref:hypothetical protein n=1 Tax=Clavibacter tessellarius TaxID=31965 RepID=UPI0039ED6200